MVPICFNIRPPSHHTVLCIFHSSLFLTKYILLEMCLVCLLSLTLLTIHTTDLISNIMRSACSRTTSGYFLIIHCLASWSVLQPWLQYMLNYNIPFRTRMGNWTYNMCSMINWCTLIKQNICSCNPASIYKILSYIIR